MLISGDDISNEVITLGTCFSVFREPFVRKVLVLEPCSLYKVDLKRVQQAGTDVSADFDKEDVKTARWFGDLEREAQELGLQRAIEVICLFSKLYPFAIDDVTTIPFAQ
ncbi:unnamed protein product, partial [Porites evermanni]